MLLGIRKDDDDRCGFVLCVPVCRRLYRGEYVLFCVFLCAGGYTGVNMVVVFVLYCVFLCAGGEDGGRLAV